MLDIIQISNVLLIFILGILLYKNRNLKYQHIFILLYMVIIVIFLASIFILD